MPWPKEFETLQVCRHNDMARSHVAIGRWRGDNVAVAKFAPKFLIDNEEHALKAMEGTGYVPQVYERHSLEVLIMQYIPPEPIQDPRLFMSHYQSLLDALRERGVRHGDITPYSVIVHADHPYLIDFAESRDLLDPRPDKRPEGDDVLLKMTFDTLLSSRGRGVHTRIEDYEELATVAQRKGRDDMELY